MQSDGRYRADDFLLGEANLQAIAWLECPDKWPNLRLAVQGDAGVGKTHLLHVYAERHGAALLPVDTIRPFMPLPDAAALAVDDADKTTDARGLLHVLNSAAEHHMPVLLAGRTAPAHWGLDLPDLNSRLRATSVVCLRSLDDALLARLLKQLLADRQLHVSDLVQAYLLLHLPRTGGALREAVARIDRLALASGKSITRTLAAAALEEPIPPQ